MSNSDDLSEERALRDAPDAAPAADAPTLAEPVIDPAEAQAEQGEAAAHAVLAQENKVEVEGDTAEEAAARKQRDAVAEDVSLDHVEDASDAMPEPLTVDTPADEPGAPPPPSPVVTPIITHAEPEKGRRRKKREGDSLWELAKTVFYAVLIAVAFRTILFQPFNIPSGSMENNLLIGDYLFISKFSYGYSIYSLPYGYWLHRHIPGLDGRILPMSPERGDIVVFKLPVSDDQDYIKRLIGLPGDRIQMKRGILYINDKPVPRTYVRDSVETNAKGETRPVKVFRETLPNGVSYETLDAGLDNYFDNTDVFLVPDGHYFMMGDNRDDSDDSRGIVGMVPFQNMEGRARFIWFSIDETAELFKPWTWPSAIRFSRMGTFVE